MHTQRDEEKFILEACKNIHNGRFLDIGAWNPIEKSNTRALFEIGWGGLLIEPSPGPVRDCVKEYGKSDRVNVLCGAVSVEGLVRPISITDDALSGNVKPEWQEIGGFYGNMFVQHYTIREILKQFGGFSFVSIDTEGTSVDVLHQLLATEMFPRCICVEFDDRLAEAIQAAQKRGYQSVHITDENVILVTGGHGNEGL